MKVVVVIPARFSATRLPGKPLRLLAGKPMIQHVYEKALQAQGVHEVLIATDHEEIFQKVKQFGGHVMMTSAGHQTGTDRIAEVARKIEGDIIVNVQGDEPLIQPSTIELCFKPLLANRSDVMATLKHKLFLEEEIQNPNFVKVITDQNDYAIYFSRYAIPFARQQCGVTWYKHIGIYAYCRDFLLQYAAMPQTPLEKSESLEQLRVIENGYRIKVLETEDVPRGVDTEEDLEKVRLLMEH